MSSCVTENTLAEFLDDQLSPHAAGKVRAHLATCPECHDLLVGMVKVSSLSARGTTSVHTEKIDVALSVAEGSNSQSPAQIEEYRIIQVLGRGSSGQVYLAHDTVLDRLVAIKFLTAAHTDSHSHQRFLVEARAIARLQHPNVVAIFRVGQQADHSYLVSEYVRGQSLDKLQIPMPWQRVRHIGIGLARGLGVAHRSGIIHRDIKPANAIIAANGDVKLLDFGLAKITTYALEEKSIAEPLRREQVSLGGVTASDLNRVLANVPHESALTDTGVLLGTPRYLAPEIWKGNLATPQSDVYSLGALLYELVAGHVLYEDARTLHELRRCVLDGSFLPELANSTTPMSRSFSAVVHRCLHPDPSHRFANGDEVCRALELVQTDHRVSSSWWLVGGIGLALTLGAFFMKRVTSLSGLNPSASQTIDRAPERCDKEHFCSITQDCNSVTGRCESAQSGWRELPPLPTPRGYCCAVYHEGAVFVFGGVLEMDPTKGFVPPIAAAERFDFASQRWSSLTSIPVPVLASRCLALRDRLYVIGGRVSVDYRRSDNSNIVQVFDPASNSWEAAPRMNRPRAWAGAVVQDGKIYVTGGSGVRTQQTPNGYEASTEVFDPAMQQWRLLPAQLGAGRYMLGMISLSAGIYAAGGSSFSAPEQTYRNDSFAQIEALDLQRESWRTVAKLPETVSTMELFTHGQSGVLLVDTRTIWRVNLLTGERTALANLPANVASHDAAMVMTPHGLFIAGGGGWGANNKAAFMYRL